MAAGPGGTLYVSIPASAGTVLARLDAGGQPRPGWPILLPGASPCRLLLPVDDGSVRVVCTAEGAVDGPPHVWAFAFDPGGRSLAGWPVALSCCGPGSVVPGRVIGGDLWVLARQYLASPIEVGQPAGNAWIVTVAADGTVRSGAQVPFVEDCCRDTWAVDPSGVAYGTVHHISDGSTAPTSELAAVSFAGVPAGFPVAIDGLASGPAFDAAGRIHVTVGSPLKAPARTLTFEANGRAADAGASKLDIAATGEFVGIEGTSDPFPAAPLVHGAGITFVVDTIGGTTVAGVDSEGQAMSGWPYRSAVSLESTGSCSAGAVCDGMSWADPTIGPDGTLYLPLQARDATVGGSIVAIRYDGRASRGWPVALRRPGSYFWSVVISDAPGFGNVHALAIEPEAGDGFSASILGISPNSTVLWTTTIIEP